MNELEMNSFFTYLQSERSAQQFLFQCYENKAEIDAKKKSYLNCNTFIYYLEHSNKFFESSKQLSTVVKPILLFYGLVHLLKAALIIERPNYPETTKVLAHGVSSRKRKKKQYTFLEDEVRIHHNGLFPYFSEHLFLIKGLSSKKFKMKFLLSLIPEMNNLFNFYTHKEMVAIGKVNSQTVQFPLYLLDTYHLTEKAFIERIKSYLPKNKSIQTKNSMIQVFLEKPLSQSFGPFFFNSQDQLIYFPIYRESFLSISEIMIHYLLLYNLSMLSRYETEWWGNLLNTKSEIDFPFISHFLNITAEKTPLLLKQEIYNIYLSL